MSKDLDIIKKIGEKIGVELEKTEEVAGDSRAYTFDDHQQVIALSLFDSKISDISQLKDLKNLTILNLSRNQISDISQLKDLKKLTHLYLHNNQISDITHLKDLKNLTTLNLGGNQISEVKQLKELKNLTVLVLNYNEISDIKQLKDLKNLTTLNLSANQISDISHLKDLKNLTKLYLKENQVSDIKQLKELKNLAQLYLRENQISDVAQLKDLKNLTQLNLSSNQISDISHLKDLKNLETLDLRGNHISELPESILNLDMEIKFDLSPTGISLRGNPLESPPIEIVKQGGEAVKNYFEAIKTKKTTRLFEAKMLIVGQGGVGKTYLMNRLVYDKIPVTKTTEGIEIEKWYFETEVAKNFRINFWDFGGQDIYHATHQFFLTKRSLYLFVWEARKDDELLSFDYWLSIINLLSDQSPVLMVMAKSDERIKHIDEQSLKSSFPNIVNFHRVSAIKGDGIPGLLADIKAQVAQLGHIGDRLPAVWQDIRLKLEESDENFISFSDYIAICKEFGQDEKQASHLSDYYHDLGVFLHFKDSPILDELVFLKPDWATNAVYKVVDTREIQENYGKFNFKQLKRIWQDYPADKYPHLLELMKKFELCFQMAKSQEYIVPELLRPEKPAFDWNNQDNLRFEYQYDFMPAGIITRFVVRTHDLNKEEIYWKYGVVLEREKTEALVISEPLNRKIRIRVRGTDSKELLGIIRREIDQIHSTLNYPDVKEMLPCICKECEKNEDPYFFSYKNLIKARDKGKSIRECQKSFEDVSIERLISGIESPDFQRTLIEPEKKDIKIFLASSGELKKEREQIQLFVGAENSKLRRENIYLDLVVWEQLKQSFHGKRIQDYFNEKMLECDVVIALFFKKVGEFTKEEFDIAYENFKQGEKPNYLYVYFKSEKVNIDEIDEEVLKISKLKKEIAEAEQIYNKFKSNEDLVLQLKKQLDLIIPEITKK